MTSQAILSAHFLSLFSRRRTFREPPPNWRRPLKDLYYASWRPRHRLLQLRVFATRGTTRLKGGTVCVPFGRSGPASTRRIRGVADERAGWRFRVVLVTPNSVSGGGSPPSSSSARQACVRACVRACGSKRIHFEIQVEVFGQAADSRARPRRDSLAF